MALLRRAFVRTIVNALNQIRPVAPPTLWFAFSAIGSTVGKGPVLTRPCASRALVLAPHPDDETIGCGGAVALLVASGADVRVLVATSGEGRLSPRRPHGCPERVQELTEACAVLGATLEGVLDLPDGDLGRHQHRLTELISEAVDRLQPEIIFVPWLDDGHPDHRAVSRALAACVRLPPRCEIWCYEVWTPLIPNRVVDVSEWWSTKEQALSCHKSRFQSFDPSAHLALGRWRSVAGLGGVGHAEAFQVLNGLDFGRMTRAPSDQLDVAL